MSTRILVVDDHEIVREGVRSLIREARPEWEICGEATNGTDAIEAVKALKPDVVVMDIALPILSGLEAASRIGKLDLGCRVLLFTMHDSGSGRLTAEAHQAGAHGCVEKSRAARQLLMAIDRVLAGGTFFGPPEADADPEKAASPTDVRLTRSGERSLETGVFEGANLSIRILLADDNKRLRDEVRALLELQPGWHVVAEAEDGRQAVQKAGQVKPDVLIIDYSMPELDGISAIPEIHQVAPNVEVVVLTVHDAGFTVDRALEAGARGYVVKSQIMKDLMHAVEAASRHEIFLSSHDIIRNPATI